VQKAFSEKDLLLIQATRALDDLDEAKSLLFQRLQEWARLNFPELVLDNEEATAALIAEFGDKEDLEFNRLSEIVGADKAVELMERAGQSFGARFDLNDRKAVMSLAKRVKELCEARREVEAYIERLAGEKLKNLSFLTDALFAARLVTTAGGLERLAKMPASTIQVIGAEKALFKHLRLKARPPKHGVIFNCGIVRSAPAAERGRVARALAGKLAIAAKADFYSHSFIAPKLKQELEERLKKIRAG
jgi:nucleolar protein 56